MTADLKKIFESKRAARRDLASKPVGEKLRIVEELTERALLTRKDTAASLPDEPWEIPTTWRWKRMGEIAKIVGGGTPRTDRSEHFGGDVPWVTPADLSGYTHKTISRGSRSLTKEGLANSGAQLLPAGTVLFSSRAPIGYVAIAANPVTTNQGFKSFVLGEELRPDFVYYYLQHARELAIALASGTTFLEISGKNAARLPVPVPSIQEQQRIVAEIEKQFTRLDVGVALLKRLHDNLKRYHASVLSAACGGRLVGNATTRPTGDSSDEPHVADGWTRTTLDAIAQIKGGITKDQKRKHTATRSVPYLRVANVQRGYLDLTEVKEILATENEIRDLTLRSGDILFNEGGDRDKLGRGWIWSGEIEECIHQNHVFRARLREGVANPKFVSWYANTIGQEFFFSEGKHTTNLASISMSKLRRLPLALPTLAEQEQIVAEVERRLSVIEEIERYVAANLQRAARLRQSILERAFSGRLVKSEATDKSVAKIKEKSPASRRHFLRALLSAEIVHQLHAEPTFGQIKHQKIFHLCEHIAEITDLDVQYHRDAAGPYDNRLIYANEAELKKQQWYEPYSRKKIGHAYRPLTKAGGHEKYLGRFGPEKIETIKRLIHLMRRWDTKSCEIFSTAYAAWNDLLLWKHEASDDAIVHEVLHRWHESKQRIPEKRWRKALEWMRKEGFVPTGFGKPTAAARS